MLEGVKSIQVESETVSLEAGEMLEVPPGAKHVLVGRVAPYRGFSSRVPVLADKISF